MVDTSLERTGGPWTVASNFLCEVEQFPFIGDFWNVGQGILKQWHADAFTLLLRLRYFLKISVL